MDTHNPKAKSSPRRSAGLSSGTASAFPQPGDVCMPTASKTPVKVYHGHGDANAICRLCGLNFKISGQAGSYQIFGTKAKSTERNELLLRRLKLILEYDENDEISLGLSTVVCKACYRKLERLEKSEGEKQLLRQQFSKIRQSQLSNTRLKRCSKSPIVDLGLGRKQTDTIFESPGSKIPVFKKKRPEHATPSSATCVVPHCPHVTAIQPAAILPQPKRSLLMGVAPYVTSAPNSSWLQTLPFPNSSENRSMTTDDEKQIDDSEPVTRLKVRYTNPNFTGERDNSKNCWSRNLFCRVDLS